MPRRPREIAPSFLRRSRASSSARAPTSNVFEAKDRELYIDLLLNEAGRKLDEKRDREWPVTGMPTPWSASSDSVRSSMPPTTTSTGSGTGKTRTAIALVDVMQRANWAKRVLFLADRTALVRQAAHAFKMNLPDSATMNLIDDNDTEGRVTTPPGCSSSRTACRPTHSNSMKRSRAVLSCHPSPGRSSSAS
jgi:type I site-specific restriction endonuclease